MIEEVRQEPGAEVSQDELTYACLVYVQNGKEDGTHKVLTTVSDMPEMFKTC